MNSQAPQATDEASAGHSSSYCGEPASDAGQPGPWGFRIFILLIASVLLYGIHNIYESMTVQQVEPLGPVLGMGALQDRGDTQWTVKTPMGYFPLKQAFSVEPGAKMVLVTMLSGNRYLCNEDRSVCAATARAGRHFSAD